MNPERFQTFAGEYVVCVAEACRNLGMYREAQENVDALALEIALTMLGRIEAKGIEAVEPYVVNRAGGAFRATCTALGLADSAVTGAQISRALQDYLDGRELGNDDPRGPDKART